MKPDYADTSQRRHWLDTLLTWAAVGFVSGTMAFAFYMGLIY